jgi:hypothetical protein
MHVRWQRQEHCRPDGDRDRIASRRTRRWRGRRRAKRFFWATSRCHQGRRAPASRPIGFASSPSAAVALSARACAAASWSLSASTSTTNVWLWARAGAIVTATRARAARPNQWAGAANGGAFRSAPQSAHRISHRQNTDLTRGRRKESALGAGSACAAYLSVCTGEIGSRQAFNALASDGQRNEFVAIVWGRSNCPRPHAIPPWCVQPAKDRGPHALAPQGSETSQ